MEKLLRQSLVLTSEHEEAVIGINGIAVNSSAFGRKIEEFTIPVLLKKLIKAVVISYVEFVPVVKTGTLQMLVCYLETERSDEVKLCTGNGAGTGNVPRVLRYLRFYEDNVKLMNFLYSRINYMIFADYIISCTAQLSGVIIWI